MEKYDFSGWATINNVRCSDGRTIRNNAFKHNDGKTVPIVWNHQHNDVNNILGHALLENRPDKGVYAYGKFNDTEAGQNAKLLVQHGDISALSIYANQLKQKGIPGGDRDVLHGEIRELSLVLASANPESYIDEVVRHGETMEDEVVIFTGEEIDLYHAESEKEDKDEVEKKEDKKEEEEVADTKKQDSEETVADVFETLSEKQKTVVYAMIGQALEDADSNDDDEGGNEEMKHNVFDNNNNNEKMQDDVLSHADIDAIFSDSKRYGSLKESVLAHGIEDIEFLFPEAKNYTQTPQFIQRDMGWVQKVMKGVHNTPFSRIKSIFADITEDEARAKGYIKGKEKMEEVFSLLKRTTTPTTIYKKQKLERDDVIDITDFDIVAWLKAEMRMMLDEEIARAALVGDGRLNSSDDKISELNIRPIWKDDDLYTIKSIIEVAPNATSDERAKSFIRAAIKSRKNYKGSGNPTLFTNEDVLTDCLLMEDGVGRIIYDSVEKLATALRVKEIITVPVLENQSREEGGDTFNLKGIIVNLADYNIGADKGGAINMFDDFDIDFNAHKYLIETRCSGALTKPYSAIALEELEVDDDTEG